MAKIGRFFACLNGKVFGFADNRKDLELLVAKVKGPRTSRISAFLPGVDAVVVDVQDDYSKDYALKAAEESIISTVAIGRVCALARARD